MICATAHIQGGPQLKRVKIRNNHSANPNKPRVFDALIDGNTVYLEVKDKKSFELIPLEDVLQQIQDAASQVNTTGTTEP